jgi:hypothetical protein
VDRDIQALATAKMKAEWLLSASTLGRSHVANDNFLWRSDRLYVMDNHRLAPWCWWQHMEGREPWNLLHIDRHFDATWMLSNPWAAHLTESHRASLDAYRNARFPIEGDVQALAPLFRWDTVVSVFLCSDPGRIGRLLFAGCAEGSMPAVRSEAITLEQALAQLEAIQRSSSDDQWIVDLDLDVFVSRQVQTTAGRTVRSDVLWQMGSVLGGGLAGPSTRHIVTVALSPETCGGWESASDLLSVLCETWGERPMLPPTLRSTT